MFVNNEQRDGRPKRILYIHSVAVRMKDAGQGPGVSIVTVSKALKNHPDVANATRERVMAKIKELNYPPDLMAWSLELGAVLSLVSSCRT